jgi:hypothetical protein
VPKGNHNRSIRSEPEQYQRRICRFLRKHAPRRSLLDFHAAPVASPVTIGLAANLPETRLDSPVCV